MESIRIQSADAACFSFQVRSVAEAHELRCILYQRVSISRRHRLKQATSPGKFLQETFARSHERCENKVKICEKAEFTRGK